MLCTTGVYLTFSETKLTGLFFFLILHLNVSPLSACSSCCRWVFGDSLCLKGLISAPVAFQNGTGVNVSTCSIPGGEG